MARLTRPLSLHLTFWSHFDRNSLIAAATLPSLTELELPPHNFLDDETALAFSTHASLQLLTVPSIGDMSEIGIRRLASIPKLRTLTIGAAGFPLTAATTAALAANTTLERLTLTGSAWPLASAAVQALAASRSLRALTVSISAGTYHLAAMENLEKLQLFGDPHWLRPRITCHDAMALSQNTRLRRLEIVHANFEQGSLNVLVGQVKVKDLRLTLIDFDEDTVTALCGNTHLSSLCLWNVGGPLAAAALANHPTLQRLNCGGSFPYNAPFDQTEAAAAAATWMGRGRSLDDLGGQLGAWHLAPSHRASPDVGRYQDHWGALHDSGFLPSACYMVSGRSA